jgi:hypothetical protein
MNVWADRQYSQRLYSAVARASRSRTGAESTPSANAPDSASHPRTSAGLFAMTLALFGTVPSVFLTWVSASAAAPVAVAGSIRGSVDTVVSFLDGQPMP